MTMATDQPLLTVTDLKQHFPIHSGILLRQTATVHAVDGISLTVRRGETLGLVGESGCGKSTLGRSIIRIYDPTAGSVVFDGIDVSSLRGPALKNFRRRVQMVFQDPFSSLNPRQTVGTIIETPLTAHGMGTERDRRTWTIDLLERVGLGAWAYSRYPHEFSGGQRQRIAIARAIAIKPDLVIADEPVSALDVSVQSQILNLMRDLQEEMGITYLFIAHDLAVVKHMAERIAVMYLGRVVELADREALFSAPLHPYTQALMLANPIPGRGRRRGREVLQGDVPSPVTPPSGCAFHPRCPLATERCRSATPPLQEHTDARGGVRLVACHHTETAQQEWVKKQAAVHGATGSAATAGDSEHDA